MKKVFNCLLLLLALAAFLYSGYKVGRYLRLIKFDVWGKPVCETCYPPCPDCPPCCPTLIPTLTPTPEITPTPTPTPTEPTPTMTSTPPPVTSTPTLTPTPEITPTPTSTATPTPTSTPTPGNGGSGGNGGEEPTPTPIPAQPTDEPDQILGASVLGATGEAIFWLPTYAFKPLLVFPQLSQPVKINLPKLGVKLSILTIEVKNNDWPVPDNQAAYLKGSGLLGQPENVVLYAHNQSQLFGRLNELQISDEIWLTDQKGKEFVYQVTSQKIVEPQAVEILSIAEEPIVTLYTCAGVNDSERLVIRAKHKSL